MTYAKRLVALTSLFAASALAQPDAGFPGAVLVPFSDGFEDTAALSARWSGARDESNLSAVAPATTLEATRALSAIQPAGSSVRPGAWINFVDRNEVYVRVHFYLSTQVQSELGPKPSGEFVTLLNVGAETGFVGAAPPGLVQVRLLSTGTSQVQVALVSGGGAQTTGTLTAGWNYLQLQVSAGGGTISSALTVNTATPITLSGESFFGSGLKAVWLGLNDTNRTGTGTLELLFDAFGVSDAPLPNDQSPPAGPATLTVTPALINAAADGFTVSWSASGATDLRDYLVEQSKDAEPFSLLDTVPNTGAASYARLYKPSSSGNYRYRVLARDLALNLSAPQTSPPSVGADLDPPVWSDGFGMTSGLYTSSTQTMAVTWPTATDDQTSSDKSVSYELTEIVSFGGPTTDRVRVVGTFVNTTSHSYTPDVTGNYRFRVKLSDAAGNVNDSGVASMSQALVDRTPPTSPTGLTGTTPTNQTFGSLSWTGSSDGEVSSGILYLLERDDGAGFTPAGSLGGTSTMVGFSGSGSYRFRVFATDGQQNKNPTPSNELTIVVDLDEPVGPGTVAVPPLANAAFDVEWDSASDSGSGLERIEVSRVGGTPMLDADLGSPFTVTPTQEMEGTHYFEVQAFDLAGNPGPKVRSSTPVLIDVSRPAKVSAGAISRDKTTGDLTVGWSSVADVGPAGLAEYHLYRTDSGTPTLVYAGAGTSYTLPAAPPGPYKYLVRAMDKVGNVSLDSPILSTVVPTRFRITTANATAKDSANDLTLEALDAAGARAKSYQGQATVSLSAGAGTLAGAPLPLALEFTAADLGVKTFPGGLRFSTVGFTSVKVADAANAAISGELAVEVYEPSTVRILRNARPYAAVGAPYQYNELGAVLASGSPPLTFSRCAGPDGLTVDPKSGAVSWTPSAVGPVGACVQATNGLTTDSYTFTVEVVAPGSATVSAAFGLSPSTGKAPLSVAAFAEGTVVTPAGLPLSYLWDFGDAGRPGVGSSTTHLYAAPGTYPVTLTVTEPYGSSSSVTHHLVVTDAGGNQAPRVTIEPLTPLTGPPPLTVKLRAVVDPPEAEIRSYAWQFDEGKVHNGAEGFAELYEEGRFTVRLTVVDGNGLPSYATTEVVVVKDASRIPPTCLALANPAAAVAPVSVRWVGVGRAATGPLASVEWSFGPEDVVQDAIVERTYVSPSWPSATFRAKDAQGLSCERQVSAIAAGSSGLPPKITSAANWYVGCQQPYEYLPGDGAPTALGTAPFTWSAEGPEGLTVDPSTGRISYRPTRHPGPVLPWVTLTATNAFGSDSQTFELGVDCPASVELTTPWGCAGAAGLPLPAAWLLVCGWLWHGLRRRRR